MSAAANNSNTDLEARIAALERANAEQRQLIESLSAAAQIARSPRASAPSFGDLDQRYYAWRDAQLQRVLEGKDPYVFSFTKPRDYTDRSAGRD